jgi:NAD(P)-dependent dehydrogenase (short-subunit alcohol dehydrogenase family)
MKAILVSGGNRGIGREICRQLDEMGHRVILCSRDLEKGLTVAQTMSGKVTVKQLDVTSEESVLKLFGAIESEFGKLDVLINNAALGESTHEKEDSPVLGAKNFLEKNIYGVRQINKVLVPLLRKAGLVAEKKNVTNVSLEHVKKIMETNFYGPWRMIQFFVPLLTKSDDPRIINVSSGMGELIDLAGDSPAYRISKTSLNALTIMFARELSEKGISVNALCPGWVKTDLGGPNATREVIQGADTAVWLATEKTIPTGKFFRDRKIINW